MLHFVRSPENKVPILKNQLYKASYIELHSYFFTFEKNLLSVYSASAG